MRWGTVLQLRPGEVTARVPALLIRLGGLEAPRPARISEVPNKDETQHQGRTKWPGDDREGRRALRALGVIAVMADRGTKREGYYSSGRVPPNEKFANVSE